MRTAPALLVLASGLLLLGACTRTDSPAPTTAAADAPVATDSPVDFADTGATMIDARFDCDGLQVAATFDKVAETATLSWPDRQLVLPQAISASGARYVDLDGNEFWNKGNEATLTLGSEPPIQCTLAATPD